MATGPREGRWERLKEHFMQKPKDFAYEKVGGDSEVPVGERTTDPLADANDRAYLLGNEVPWPSHVRTSSEPRDGGKGGVLNAYVADKESIAPTTTDVVDLD